MAISRAVVVLPQQAAQFGAAQPGNVRRADDHVGGRNASIASQPELTKERLFCSFAGSLVLAVAPAMAQTDLTREQSAQAGGRDGSSTAIAGQFVTSIAVVTSTDPISGAQFASGGVGLRNRGTGAIGISGVVTPVKAAFIYWAVITSGPAPPADKSIMVLRLSPAPASAVTTVAGTIVGTGPQPCWAGDTITVFRGSIPTSVATGNGLYKVTLLSGASGSTSLIECLARENQPITTFDRAARAAIRSACAVVLQQGL